MPANPFCFFAFWRTFSSGSWPRLPGSAHRRCAANALAKTINGLYKAELLHRRAPWNTKEAVELATLKWVFWFNHHMTASARDGVKQRARYLTLCDT